MASKKSKKKAKKFEYSRADLTEVVSDIRSMVSDLESDMYDTSPNEANRVLGEIANELESLSEHLTEEKYEY